MCLLSGSVWTSFAEGQIVSFFVKEVKAFERANVKLLRLKKAKTTVTVVTNCD